VLEGVLFADGGGGWGRGSADGDVAWIESGGLSAGAGVDGWVGTSGDGERGAVEWEGRVLLAVELCGTEEAQEGDGDAVQVGLDEGMGAVGGGMCHPISH
jgi:hypothetical protein